MPLSPTLKARWIESSDDWIARRHIFQDVLHRWCRMHGLSFEYMKAGGFSGTHVGSLSLLVKEGINEGWTVRVLWAGYEVVFVKVLNGQSDPHELGSALLQVLRSQGRGRTWVREAA